VGQASYTADQAAVDTDRPHGATARERVWPLAVTATRSAGWVGCSPVLLGCPESRVIFREERRQDARMVIRSVYRLASKHTPDQLRQSIKAVARRLLPSEVRARLNRRLRRILPESRTSERALRKDVSSISRALWMGFESDALAELERIRRADVTPEKPIARASETLARWYATNKKHDVALDRLIHARVLDGQDHPERLRVLEHHLLTELGLFEEADRLFGLWGSGSADLHLMQANLRLRQAEAGALLREDADIERLELIDWVFRQRSLVPVSELVNSDVLEFSSLAAGSLAAVTPDPNAGGPVVSIVVPAYNAESTLTTSVNSLRAQSFSGIEVLIVDDASTDNTSVVAKELAALDPRIKVVRHSQNQGAYGARNTGLMNATGEYFTVHDADDWSHPQMVERQLEVLRDGHAMGSFSRLARVTPKLEFLLRPYRRMLEPIHWSYTSLLAKTETLRDFGGWDTVRAHADSELIERLRDFYGRSSLVEAEMSVPLSFFLVTGKNLTERKDTSLRSVDFGSRREYSEQARFWRKRTFGDGEIPSYNEYRRAGAKSPFFAARSLAPNRDRIDQSYDLVIGSDLALKGGTRSCNVAYIDCARKLGLRIGIFNMPRYRLRGSGTIDPTYRELFQLDRVDLLTPEDHVSAQTLLLHHPPVLRKEFSGHPRVTAAGHYLLVNQLPWEMTDRSGDQYQTGAVRRRYEEAFGAEPIWIPISPRVRRYLEPELPPEVLHHEDWYPIVNWSTSTRPRDAIDSAAAPVVGRHSRDHATKWPETAHVLEKCYLAGSEYEVRLLGGVSAAEKVLGYRPKNWVVFPFDSVPVEDFLAGIDIFLHFHHSTYIEEFGRNIAEAMAKGIPCILPPEYAETFGDAAVYAEPGSVADAVKDLWADPGTYAEYTGRGIAFVERHCGMEAGMSRIASLLP
jgi:glycosyltransferase involved in cell wall biosynthesis